ncbi:MAG: starvation/stationary phase protection protein [Paenibacillus sp.]|nr:starvation/stationary phase protection protein [Paenibacillus sp.]
MSKQAVATKSVVEILNKQVANWSVMYMKLHSFHWFVKGKDFYTLHIKFEELYNEATLIMDEVAERILAIKGKPQATLKEHLATASIKEAKGDESPDQMIKALIADFQAIINELGEGIESADEQGDAGTADMLTGIQIKLEKHVWMLEALMG